MTGYAERRDDYTEQDDIRLAKNAAVEQGGNTIYRIDHPEDGREHNQLSIKSTTVVNNF